MNKCLYFSLFISFAPLYASENAPTPPPRRAYADQLEKLQARVTKLEQETQKLSKENSVLKRASSLLIPTFELLPTKINIDNKNIKLADGVGTALKKLRESEY